MKESRYLFIAYDIRDDEVRTKLANLLIYYGLRRIQYSVFKGEVLGEDKERVLEAIRELGLGLEDKVHVVELCANCKRGIIVFGEENQMPQHLIF